MSFDFKKLEEKLFSLKDGKFCDFNSSLIPSVKKESVIGIKTPLLKQIAKEIFLNEDYSSFLDELPHKYFEENQIHAFLLFYIKDYEKLIFELEKFFPFVDNWATCDQIKIKINKKNLFEFEQKINSWLYCGDENEYCVRFAVRMLMNFFLDENFNVEVLQKVLKIKTEKYYVKMMISWFFATALAKQYEETIKIFYEKKMDLWIFNKSIQKALESFRVPKEHKDELRKLKTPL